MNEASGYGEIKIGDKVLPFKFGTNSYYLFCNHRNIGLDKIGEAFSDPFALLELAYFAHVTAERIRGGTAIGIDEFIELVGDNENIIPQFEKLINTSKAWGVSVGDSKKKL